MSHAKTKAESDALKRAGMFEGYGISTGRLASKLKHAWYKDGSKGK